VGAVQLVVPVVLKVARFVGFSIFSVPPERESVLATLLSDKFAPWAVKDAEPERVALGPPARTIRFVTVRAFVAFAVPAVKLAFATRAPAPATNVPPLAVMRFPLKDPVRFSVPALMVVAPV
jgi:hypothetical protein